VALSVSRVIADPSTGNSFDCAPDLCSAAITADGS